ncbi:MAG: hypothetical protein RL266_867 [Bacteroidota bacterium]
MLARLHVRNYAIISELDVRFADGLTIITGETGAGKSILIGALSLVLGKRADTSALYNAENKCVVEAYFDVKHYDLKPFFEENDLDYEPITILRREITASGKSRAFINDTPVNLNQLRDLASLLIDIHSQHEVLTLNSMAFRARFLDACADGGSQHQLFEKLYANWSELKRRLQQLRMELQNASAEEDYLRFQLNELADLNLHEGELSANQDKLTLLENAEEINRSLDRITNAFSAQEGAILDLLQTLDTEVRSLAKKFPKAKEWSERLHSDLIDLQDIAAEMEHASTDIPDNPSELQNLQERVDEILRLMTKHRKHSDTELLEFQSELEAKLNTIGHSDEQMTLLNAELESKGAKLESEADSLSELRQHAAKKVAPLICSELHEMGMPDAQMQIQINRTEMNALGQDSIEMKFTSNKGQALQDISKIASGGELSRLMLAVKSEIAKTSKLPAIIFDEIDTGVSGDVADRVGNKIKKLSSRMQVLCITHLPQIASKADQHLYVYKELENGKTITKVRALEKDERIVEIAKMLSNANPTEAALAHAKNLVNEK